MSLLSKLFGKSESKQAEPEVYQDFRIFAEPVKDGGQYRIGARIEKDFGGETRTHLLIRADTMGGLEAATEASVLKAKMLIDQQGDRIF